MSFDGGGIYFTEQVLLPNNRRAPEEDGLSLQPIEAEVIFMRFLKESNVNGQYIYREQIQQNAQKGEFKLTVQIEDITNYDTRLGDCLRTRPADYLPSVSYFTLSWKPLSSEFTASMASAKTSET